MDSPGVAAGAGPTESPSDATDTTTEALDTSQPVDTETLQGGTVAGNYVIEDVLGVGGGGIVYLARHKVLRRKSALKVLRRHLANSPKMTARFVREATTVTMIGHPNIVEVYEFGELEDGRPFYVMELIEGTDLRKLLTLHGRLTPLEALDILEPVCLALAAAHEAGVVHRDLKASNVLVIEKNAQRVIKLVDFGIAKLLHPEPGDMGLTTPGSVLGTVHTMSPEQVLCEAIDVRTDVYSLGILLFHLLTGRLPFQGRREEIARMHLDVSRPRPSDFAAVPPAIDAIVLRAMDRFKDRRYQTVASFLTDLRRAVLGEAAAAADASGMTIGAYVEIRTTVEEEDDALLDELTNVLDLCEAALHDGGFALPLQTSNALLGVKALPAAAEEQRAACEQVRQSANDLLEQIANRDFIDPRVFVTISLHVDNGVCQMTNEGLEVKGGPILQTENWAPPQEAQGLYLSSAFEQALK
jgi:serine/threonine-protein kinase